MVVINIAVIFILLVCIMKGYHDGFARKLLSIFSFFVAGICAWIISGMIDQVLQFMPHLEDLTLDLFLYDTYNRLVIFVILFIIILMLLMALRPIARLLNHIPVLSFFNRLAGSVLGFVQGVLLLFLVAFVIQLPFFEKGHQLVQGSWLMHTNKVADALLFYTKYPMEELAKLKDVLEDKESFTQEEAQRFEGWLREQNLEETQIEQLINLIKVESV